MQDKCFALFSNDNKCAAFPENSEIEDNVYGTETVDKDNKIDGISLHYEFAATKCAYDKTKNYSLEVNIKCNKDAKTF